MAAGRTSKRHGFSALSACLVRITFCAAVAAPTALAQGLSVVVTERDAETQDLMFRGAAVDRGEGLVAVRPGNSLGVLLTDYATATTIPFETSVLGAPQPIGSPTVTVPDFMRAQVFQDQLLNSNLQNPSVDTGIQFSFINDPGLGSLINGPGPDLIIFELSPPAGVTPPSGGPTVLGGDPLRLLNPATGETLDVFSGDFEQFGGNGFTGSTSFFTSAGAPFASLDDLQTGELAFVITVPGLNLYGTAVDLSDLGVADGAGVSDLTLQSIASTGFGPDIGLIAGLPAEGLSPAVVDGALQLSAFGPFVEDFVVDVLSPQGGAPAFSNIEAPLFTTISVDDTDTLAQEVTGDFLLDGSVPLTPQAGQVGAFVTVLLALGVEGPVFDALSATSDLGVDGLELGLRQLSPEPYATAPVVLASETADYQGRALRDRYGRALREPRELGRWAFWIEGFGALQNQDGDAASGLDGFDQDIFGASAGADTWLSSNMLFGVHGGYVQGEAEFDELTAEVELETFTIGAYGVYSYGPFHFALAGAYGFGDVEAARAPLGPTGGVLAEADYDLDQIMGFAELGARFGGEGAWLAPKLDIVYTNLDRDAFSETGAAGFNLTVLDIGDVNILHVEPQLEAGLSWDLAGFGVSPRAVIGYRYETLGEDTDVLSLFSGAPTVALRIDGAEFDRTAVFGGVGVDVDWSERLALFAQYEGLGGGAFSSHEISAGLKIVF
ncbi:MAG: autotransporter outer membrane beta-barrel domain-containing protein [Pseudomonadota bacterium]